MNTQKDAANVPRPHQKARVAMKLQLDTTNIIVGAWQCVLTIVLPTVAVGLLASSLLHVDVWWFAAAVVVIANLIIRFGGRARIALSNATGRKHLRHALKNEQERVSMLRSIDLSPFSRRYWPHPLGENEVGEGTVEGRIYIDDAQHWFAAVELFFNPFSGRPSPPGIVVRSATKLVCWAWLGGWLLVIVALMSRFVFVDMPLLTELSTGLTVTMILWTALWLAWVVWLFPRDRMIVSDRALRVITRRLPFQDEEPRIVLMTELQSANMRVTLWGKLFGFGSFEFISWQNPEPIPMRKHVKDYRRVQTVLDDKKRGDERLMRADS